MRIFDSAQSWDYRWRMPLLFLSQPALALIYFGMNGFQGLWYSPEFSPLSGIIATVLAGCGVALRVWGTSFLTTAVVTGFTARNDRLVVGGPFAMMRNPLYLGTMLIFAGFATFFGWIWILPFVAFHWLRNNRVIRYEESVLRDEWGREFDDYCRAVPRWFPKQWNRKYFAGPFVTFDGLVGNGVFIGMFAGFAVSAWWGTLDPLVVFQSLGFGVVIWSYLRPQVAKPEAYTVELPEHSVLPVVSDDDIDGQRRHAG